ncbi:NTP transferase domain-containing protein [Methylobacterium sp. WL18]|uniref:glycosyltransferase family 2 protein n=1 Tax=Methylobacterium sp. WL18 TaxID=2603897 RepID=UPI0011CA08A1|nr:glycosyltransferase family 2 protein [Methylobacterium sp. WL18]TXN75965.1 NTP transferase domain-containing protein [Methylobacterium sp. WL18]
MLNIVIPMAGRGSRFASVGYAQPKPLIPLHGIPMIKVVIDNLRPSRPHRFIFICQGDHVRSYGLAAKLASWAPGSALVEIESVTEGAACTVLLAEDYITSDSLMIANSDQYIDYSIDSYLEYGDAKSLDGLIMTMTADDPKWSFVGLGDDGCVTRVVEKQVISNEATVGIYNFRNGKDFVTAARRMIAADKRVNGEFYVAPVYEELIEAGSDIGIVNIGREADGMYGLGTPVDLELFLSLPLSRRAAGL